MGFDVLAEVVRPGALCTVHNVLLLAVLPIEADGRERFTVEYEGRQHQVLGGRWNGEFSLRNVGKVGCLVPSGRMPTDESGSFFRPYQDQSLRRVPAFDLAEPGAVNGKAREVVAWSREDEKSPRLFWAPPGLIPGQHGRFVSDETEPVTLRVPPEFIRECRRYQMTPEQLLRSFIGDVAGIHNYADTPRADRYGSNGSDERDLAEQWLERAHGLDKIDIIAWEAALDDSREKDERREDFGGYLDDFEYYGGKPEELIQAVQAIVDKQIAAHNSQAEEGDQNPQQG